MSAVRFALGTVVAMGLSVGSAACSADKSDTGTTTAATATSAQSAATQSTQAASDAGTTESTSSSGPPTHAADDLVTPIVAEVLAAPVPALSTDGKVHLAYELLLTDAVSTELTIESIAVMDGDKPVQTLEGDGLKGVSRAIGGALGVTTLVPGQGAMVFVDAVVDSYDQVPAAIDHVITMTLATPNPPILTPTMTETVARVVPVDEKPVVVGPPLEGSRWLDGNSCCAVTPHRAAVTPVNGSFWAPERFAIDFVQFDEANREFDGPIDGLSSYKYYGANIIAVADGPIVAMVSDEQEWTPGADPTGLRFEQYGGNYIVQDLGNGQFAFYAHLQPGNPRGVAVGDQVKKGQVIGLLGNSGNSDSPHLHFHVMDGPDPLVADGVPFVIEPMRYEGRLPSMAALPDVESGKAVTIDTADAGERTGQSPLVLDVLGFPEAGS